MSCNPSASRLFLLQCWELRVLVLPALPLHPARRKPWPCWKLLKFVWIKHVCVSASHIHMCAQVKVRGLKLLWSPAAMSKKCKCTLLDILESSAVDPHRCAYACMMDTSHTLWSHMVSLNLHHQNFRKFPTRMRTGSSGSFLISACKQNFYTQR